MSVTCPGCGAEIPQETGQHALNPMTGLVHCPTCGEKVELPKAEVEGAESGGGSGRDDYFAGSETIEGVTEELEDKEES